VKIKDLIKELSKLDPELTAFTIHETGDYKELHSISPIYFKAKSFKLEEDHTVKTIKCYDVFDKKTSSMKEAILLY
jgi:hypothetical protein